MSPRGEDRDRDRDRDLTLDMTPRVVRKSRILALTLGAAAAAGVVPGCTRPVAEDAPARIFAESSRAVVMVRALDQRKRVLGTGSGFLVRPDGVFITNHHVVSDAAGVSIHLPDGRDFRATGVVALDENEDVAILKVRAADLPTVRLGDSDRLRVGDRVLAIGNPLGLDNSLSDGLVSSIRNGPGRDEHYLQISAPISPGSSGGPLFDTRGEVVGITSASEPEGQNLNFAVPINIARALLPAGEPKVHAIAGRVGTSGDERCPVVGNARSRVYQVPGGERYARMRASPDAVCFHSEAEARGARFRKGRR